MTDRLVVRLVVTFLGVGMLAALGIAGVLSYQSKSIPDAIIALGSAALGGISSLLVRTSSEPPTESP